MREKIQRLRIHPAPAQHLHHAQRLVDTGLPHPVGAPGKGLAKGEMTCPDELLQAAVDIRRCIRIGVGRSIPPFFVKLVKAAGQHGRQRLDRIRRGGHVKLIELGRGQVRKSFSIFPPLAVGPFQTDETDNGAAFFGKVPTVAIISDQPVQGGPVVRLLVQQPFPDTDGLLRLAVPFVEYRQPLQLVRRNRRLPAQRYQPVDGPVGTALQKVQAHGLIVGERVQRRAGQHLFEHDPGAAVMAVFNKAGQHIFPRGENQDRRPDDDAQKT